MFRALQYVILLVTVVMTGFYVSIYQPELVNALLIKCDVLYISKVARDEHERMEKIRALTIPYEEKQVLMNRTVFMQASPDMVELALGKPQNHVPRDWPGHTEKLLYYVYYLADDKRPTILIFADDKLIDARKGSALDLTASK